MLSKAQDVEPGDCLLMHPAAPNCWGSSWEKGCQTSIKLVGEIRGDSLSCRYKRHASPRESFQMTFRSCRSQKHSLLPFCKDYSTCLCLFIQPCLFFPLGSVDLVFTMHGDWGINLKSAWQLQFLQHDPANYREGISPGKNILPGLFTVSVSVVTQALVCHFLKNHQSYQ